MLHIILAFLNRNFLKVRENADAKLFFVNVCGDEKKGKVKMKCFWQAGSASFSPSAIKMENKGN